MSCDLLIKGGTVVDGTGATPAFVRSRQPRHSSINALPTARLNLLPAAVQVGDVAVADGKIVAVGPDLGMEAAKVIDASGKHVMPGWTDIHTHYDTQCMWDPQLLPSGPGGVTSASAHKPHTPALW